MRTQAAGKRDGLFRWAGARLSRAGSSPRRLLLVALALVAGVTALLNLDTAVVFLTPVLVGAARVAGVPDEPFLYGSVLMANASSLLLPGANLTNLLVLAHEDGGGAQFAVRVLPGATAAAAVTALALARLARAGAPAPAPAAPAGAGARPRTLAIAACALAAMLVLVLPDPGLAVLVVGVAAVLVRVRDGRLGARAALEAIGPAALAALFALSVLLGLLARGLGRPRGAAGPPGPTRRRTRARCCSASTSARTSPSPARCRRTCGSARRARAAPGRRRCASRSSAPRSRSWRSPPASAPSRSSGRLKK